MTLHLLDNDAITGATFDATTGSATVTVNKTCTWITRWKIH
jgi:hypothetical protein